MQRIPPAHFYTEERIILYKYTIQAVSIILRII